MKEFNKDKQKIITQRTTNFYSFILDKLEANNINIDLDTLNLINDFLYLINTSSYYKVSKTHHIDRETLIERFLNQIVIFLCHSDTKKIENTDIKTIINSCFFIRASFQEEIINEFTEVTKDFTKAKTRNIANSYINSSELKEAEKNLKNAYHFDPTNKENYKALVEGLTSHDEYLENYGNLHNIEWDYDILENVVKIILSYRDEIKKSYPVGAYSDFNLISSYIYNVMCYSVINKKAEINYQSLLSTFKDWEDVPYKIKLKITATIIEKLELTEMNSPFIEKYKPEKNGKIIKFLPKKGKQSNERNN